MASLRLRSMLAKYLTRHAQKENSEKSYGTEMNLKDKDNTIAKYDL
jgi:hypothetical protein